jgi:hypothetical protein
MKRIITTASIAALGAVSLQAAYAPGLSETERAKPWSVSATLRGFYDDNYTTLPSHADPGFPTKQASWGLDVSPKFSLNLPLQQTSLGLDYIYDMRWYADRSDRGQASADHSHQINARASHEFSEGYKLDLNDSFVIAQEPELLNGVGGGGSPLRLDGNNLRNNAAIKFHGDLTRNFGFELGYSNTLIDYDQNDSNKPSPFTRSYSALLDRMEHLANVDFRYRALPQTWAILGYQFGVIDHTSKDSFLPGSPFVAKTTADPSVRDERSHYFYVGAEQMFTKNINGAVRIGAQYTEWPNHAWLNPGGGGNLQLRSDSVTPYADASGTYTFLEGSSVQLGVRHSRIQTDIISLDEEATSVYGSFLYKITPKLKSSILGSAQFGSFEGSFDTNSNVGTSDERYYTLGLNLEYDINQFLAAETGYNFDRLDSGIHNRSYSRNRVYFGIRASY